ncbi:hypothetical protein IFT98_12700 [Pseudomonas sp. CFBP 8770]|uniref:hypothetical protein n=1 Tax=unclassified Pseudomonas TaxID=196821 RepID=UPI001781F14C|nr:MULTISPECIES: hypothetical protein [unclassified Pseudomonas]MBD8474718.1 hypothetical protein [Pseudomonas sp. CFBP 8773]MBD8647847.1 hypothetical protein [Pseudomonas sp. CFBP 8770]
MDGMYEYRYQTHALLLELDACNAGLMALVARQQIGTEQWEAALKQQQAVFKSWQAHARGGAQWHQDSADGPGVAPNVVPMRATTSAR